MCTFTVEQLTNAIRTADSLSELKRMVGPTEAQNEQSSKRIAEIDSIGEQYGYNTETMPWHVAERYKRLMAEQDAFEGEYC